MSLPVLAYHALDDSGSVVATTPRHFAATLAALAGAGFRCVDLHDWIAQGRPSVQHAFALTFDDGYRSIRLAADLIASHGFCATAFLITGRMDGDSAWPGQRRDLPRAGLIAWSELADLRAGGIRFGAHTRTHPRLDRLDPLAIDEELRGSRDDIEQQTGETCPLLAYPYGVAPRRVRDSARRHFEAAFGTRLACTDRRQDLHDLSRIDAHYLRTPRAVERLVRGELEPCLRARRALRGVRAALTAG